MLAEKTSKNRLTLPKGIVKAFPNTEYLDVSVKDGKIVLCQSKYPRRYDP